MQIAVVNMGVGNLQSVLQAMQTVAPAASVLITDDVEQIRSADKVVLPGQGAVGTWFSCLENKGLKEVIVESIGTKPLFGICVGMQALFDFCEEDGGLQGLGLFDGEVRHFSNFHKSVTDSLKIPQMGWNQVKQSRKHPIWHGVAEGAHFYFVHSYCANASATSPAEFVVGEADYGHEFIAAAAAPMVFSTQFHPEKSHDDGLRLLRNFADWNGD
jgi:imidazole glycerol phosphate synthase, glutamine amidotransferase subunit